MRVQKKFFAIFSLFAVVLLSMLTSCQKDENESSVSNDYSALTIQDLESTTLDIDKDKSYAFFLELNRIKEANKGLIPDVELQKLGDPNQNIELKAAMLVSEYFEIEDVLSPHAVSNNEDNTIETRSWGLLRWDGKSTRFSFWCWCTQYKCGRVQSFNNSCNGSVLNYNSWQRCSNVQCNKPSCG